MTLYFIRHGQTALNAARILQPADTPLCEVGLEQAQLLAQRLKMLPLSAVLCSDLLRAQQTAQALLALRPHLEYRESALLQERNFGQWRGLSYDSIGQDLHHLHDAPPGGESMPAFRERVAQAFNELCLLAKTFGHVAVVTHGLVIRELLANHCTWADTEMSLDGLGNTSVTQVQSMPAFRVLDLNCTRHLQQTQHRKGFGG